jgi:hypothetical protein
MSMAVLSFIGCSDSPESRQDTNTVSGTGETESYGNIDKLVEHFKTTGYPDAKIVGRFTPENAVTKMAKAIRSFTVELTGDHLINVYEYNIDNPDEATRKVLEEAREKGTFSITTTVRLNKEFLLMGGHKHQDYAKVSEIFDRY